jgi:hypothetical protein
MAGSCKNSKDISIHIHKLRKEESIYRMAESQFVLAHVGENWKN